MAISLRCDTHTHTLFSRHAYSTIEENVGAARDTGLELLVSTDHFSDMLFPDFRNYKNYQYLSTCHIWPLEWKGITLLRGCEADIVDLDGHLFGYDIPIDHNVVGDPYKEGSRSLYDRVTEKMHYVIGSVHSTRFAANAGSAACTEAYLRVLEDPKILMLGHIGRSGLPIEIDPILLRAKELHKLIEINSHSMESGGRVVEKCRRIAERCAELGVSIAVNSDAHVSADIGNFRNVPAMLEEIHFPEELIATRSRESFLAALRMAHTCPEKIIPV